MRFRYFQATLYLILSLLVTGSSMAAGNVRDYRFAGIQSIEIEAVTGSIDIYRGEQKELIVTFINKLKDPEILKVTVDTSDGDLYIKETFLENNPKGTTHWTIIVPSHVTLQNLDFVSGMGEITLKGIKARSIKCHSGDGSVLADSLTAERLVLSTADKALTVRNCEISDYGSMISASGKVTIDLPRLSPERLEVSCADGDVTISLPYLPPSALTAGTTSKQLTLRVLTFGDSFDLTIMKNEGCGKVVCPFPCTEEYTKRIDKHDTYRTDCCIVTRGAGGPKVKLWTGTGTIKILTDKSYDAGS